MWTWAGPRHLRVSAFPADYGVRLLPGKFVGTTMCTSGRCSSVLVHTLCFAFLDYFCPQNLSIMRADTIVSPVLTRQPGTQYMLNKNSIC